MVLRLIALSGVLLAACDSNPVQVFDASARDLASLVESVGGRL